MTWDMSTLRMVNSKINELPYSDQVGDDWDPYTKNGFDCNNYATRKMEELHAMGVPLEAMRLATGWTRHNQQGYHAVLLVDLNGQTYVLDNRYPLPIEHQVIPYEWHKFQKAGTREWELAK